MGQIEDLRLFALVVENRSISKAAARMHIAKSAVSRRLSALEARYGSRLIDREPGKWEVTSTGLELFQRAIRIVNDADEIENDFAEAPRNLAGPLTISIPRDFGLSFLNTALRNFKNRYPEIRLTVDFDDHQVDLSRDNYDFAIRITPKLEPDVVARQIGTTRHRICAAPDYLARNGRPETLKDLDKHSLLHFGGAIRAHWDFIDQSGKIQSKEFQPTLNSNSGAFLLEATLSGMGIARLPDFICDAAVQAGQLETTLSDFSVSDWGIFLIHAEDRRLNRRMRLFSQEMVAASVPGKDAFTT